MGASLLTVLHSRVAAWTPSSVSGLLLWLDRSPATMTINIDGTGGAPAVDSTDLVGRRIDQSSHGRLYSSPTTGKRPRYRDNGSVNGGRKTVEYDGADDVHTPASNWGPSGAFTLLVEVDIVSVGSGSFAHILGTDDGTSDMVVYAAHFSGYQSWCFRGPYTSSGASVGFGGSNTSPGTGRKVVVITYDGVSSTSTSSYTARLNGSAQTINASGAFGTGSFGGLGASPASSEPFNGRIGKVAMWDSVLSAGDITAAEAWADV